MLSTGSILLAVLALAIAAPDNYGSYGQSKPNVKPNIKANIKNKAILTTTLANDVPAEFDCAGKDDGGYVIGCSQDYFLCWKGVMTKSSCPEGMVFNQENGQCDFNNNVFECTGVQTTTLAAEPTTTLKPVDFDCSKLTDGDYAFSKDCQLTYVSCVGGQGVERTCPDGLSFDPENRLCDHLENIEACGGSPTTVAPTMEIKFDCPSPSGSFALTSQLCSAVYYICKDNIAAIAICDDPMIWDDSKKVCALPKDIPDCSFDCAGKADAAYSEGCAQTYWWCWQERATKLSCPDMMMFDAERQMCDFHDNVFECTGVKTTTLAAEPIPTLPPVDFDCSALEDGNHAFTNGEKCQAKFVSCVGGHAWEMTCPDGLLFDPDMLQCERIDAIVACGGTAEPITTTTKDYSYKQTTTIAKKVVLPNKKITKAPYTTTIADVPTTTDSYGSYDQSTLADEPITTTRKAYAQRTTKLADVPTTRRHHQRKTTTLADMPTTRAYGGYQTTTPLADVPTTKAYGVKRTTLADVPTTRRVHQRKTTTVADVPITTTLGYNSDYYASTILLDEPTTRNSYGQRLTTLADLPTTRRHQRKTTTLADLPTTRSYGGYQTTTLADVPTTKAYGYKRTTTLADIPTTKAYGFKRTTTLADIPTTKAYGFKRTTTIADVPTTTDSYGSYDQTTLADIPTTRRRMHKTTTIADVPTTTESYGSYDQTTLEDEPITTTRSYGGYQTTTLADLPTTRRHQRKTTTLADLPTTRAYGGYQTSTLADLPITTMRPRSYTKLVKDVPTTRKFIQQNQY